MKVSEEIVENIIGLSQRYKQSEIAKIFGLSQPTVSKLLKVNGVCYRRNRLNESKLKFNINYFDIIDCSEKAYWLGFITADGCLKSNKVRLVSKDLEVLEKFKKAINSVHKIVENKTTDKRSGKEYCSYVFSVTNNLFCKKIQKYVNIDKSDRFSLPNIEERFYSYFIAGMFDGDGHIGKSSKNRIRISLISTTECLEQIQEILLRINISKTKLQIFNKYSTLHIFKDSVKFLDFIYKDDLSEIYLNRKYIKYKKYKYENCIL